MIKRIALHEFWFTVRRPGYYLVTLGMPLIMLAYFGLLFLIALATVPDQQAKLSRPVGVVDRSGLLTSPGSVLHQANPGEILEIETNPRSPVEQDSSTADSESESGTNETTPEQKTEGILDSIDAFEAAANRLELASGKRQVILFDDLNASRSQLEDESLQHVVVVPDDYLQSGKLELYVKKSQLIGGQIGTRWMARLIEREILESSNLDTDQKERIRRSPKTVEFEIAQDQGFVKVDKLARGFTLGIPLAICGTLITALIMNGSLLLTSISEEKENKVMEVILSSVSADQLLFGKVLGIVTASLLQICIWSAMVAVIPTLSMIALKEVIDFEVDVIQLLIGGVFIILGFLFYGCILAGLGSLGSNQKDCQQLSTVPIIISCVPLMLSFVFLNASNGTVARCLSLIPLFTPTAMMLRLGLDKVPVWEIVVALLLMIVSIYLVVRISARLFRIGALMQGKRPNPIQIFRLMFQK